MATFDEPQQPEKQKSWIPTCLISCGVIFLLLIAICAGGAWYVSRQAPIWLRDGLVKVVNDSDMAEKDKQAVVQQIDRLVDGFKAGKIGYFDMPRIVEKFARSPVFALVIVRAVQEGYLKPSGLPEEEKEAGRRTIQRIARGIVEQKLKQDDLESAVDLIAENPGEDQRKIKKKLTDEELRKFLAECKRIADEANIPDEEYAVDIGKEMTKTVDAILNK